MSQVCNSLCAFTFSFCLFYTCYTGSPSQVSSSGMTPVASQLKVRRSVYFIALSSNARGHVSRTQVNLNWYYIAFPFEITAGIPWKTDWNRPSLWSISWINSHKPTLYLKLNVFTRKENQYQINGRTKSSFRFSCFQSETDYMTFQRSHIERQQSIYSCVGCSSLHY